MAVSNSLFYCNIENTEEINELIKMLEQYTEKSVNPVYIIDRPLEEKNNYSYEKAVALLIPKYIEAA